jgi:ABC-2 type transport system ATP-binding protein
VVTAAPAIDIHDLRKTYRDGLFRRRSVEALKGVSFQVGQGEIFGLLGPNGAGKTTLIKVLLGVVRRTSGQATLLGRPAGDRIGRRRVGYLPEHHRIPRHHTGNSALFYYGQLSGLSRAQIRSKMPELLAAVGLADWGRTSIRKYSKGMQQRLGLAQALLHDPDVLILDEPTDGVDPVGRSEMRALLQRLKAQGKTIFLNSHLLQEVELVCDRVAILDHGLVRQIGSVADLTQRRGGNRQELEVQFTLVGAEAAIRGALSTRTLTELRPAADGRHECRLRAADQSDVDGTIDDLRRGGISIVALSHGRQTLEEAFLKILTESGPAA